MPTLDWLNREDAFRIAARVPTRVLRPHAAAPATVGDDAAATDNLLVQGDNLEALAALLPFYRGRVKCIFIDPPYNTKSAFEHYDDNLEHSAWLTMMLPRLQLLREFLREDGSIWVTIDDNEGHYLKVLMDEVFGRGNFVGNIVWQKAYGPKPTAYLISESHDHVLAYGRTKAKLNFALLTRSDAQQGKYRNPDNDPRGPWKPENSSLSLLSGNRGKQYAKTGASENLFEITSPTGKKHLPTTNRCWAFSPKQYPQLLADNRIWFGDDGNGRPSIKRFLAEVSQGVLPQTVWTFNEVGHNQESSREIRELFGNEPFGTPKPERLMQRVIHIATNENDLVLDSFLGSGTTAAVAHKMGRRWIGIEMGEHAITHCLPRLTKVIEGEQGGISAAVNWQGGGGFRVMQLGAPLFDAHGDIHPEVRFADLAAFLWMRETGGALETLAPGTPLVGTHDDTACYLLFNGVLGDRRPAGGNVLNGAVLDALRATYWHAGPKVIYGEACRLGAARLAAEGITFRQLPHAVPR